MIRKTKKIMLFMTLFMAGLTTQCQQNKEDAHASYLLFVSNIAVKMIDAMQGALHLNRLTHQQLAVSANQETTNSLMIKVNESKLLFTHLLDEYIENLGQVYEKKAGLFGGYRTSYYISSKADQSLAITPDQYAALMQTLQNASQQSDWGTTIKIMFPVMSHENHIIIEKNVSLNEIIAAIKQVPLPVEYSPTVRGIAIGAVAGAAAVGAYYAYNTMDALKNSVHEIENDLSKKAISEQVAPAAPAAPVVEAEPEKISLFNSTVHAYKNIKQNIKQHIKNADEKATAIEQQSNGKRYARPWLQDMGNGIRRGVYGDEDATVANWQAGGDAENYSTPGLTGQEMLGAVAGGAAFGVATETAAARAATQYQTNKNAQFMANQQKAILGQPLAQQVSTSTL